MYERRPTGRGMTPAVYKRGAHGVDVSYAIADSPLGRLLVAATPKGICSVKLGDRDNALEDDLRREYPAASISRDRSDLTRWVKAILTYLNGRRPHLDLPLDIQATAFQWKVWRYLQSIPYGETRVYGQVARDIGEPAAVRAVARACATNPVCRHSATADRKDAASQDIGGVGRKEAPPGQSRILASAHVTESRPVSQFPAKDS